MSGLLTAPQPLLSSGTDAQILLVLQLCGAGSISASQQGLVHRDPKDPPGLGDAWLLGHEAVGRGSRSSAEHSGMRDLGWKRKTMIQQQDDWELGGSLPPLPRLLLELLDFGSTSL